MLISQKAVISNQKGLHARAAAKLVQLIEQFKAKVLIEKDGLSVSGNSIMGLLMLAASQGTEIAISAEGIEASEVVKAVISLVQDKFGEEV